MGVLAKIIDRQCAMGRFERFLRVTRSQLNLPEPDQGIERQSLKPLPLAGHPIGPSLFWNSHIGQEALLVEADCLGE